MREELLRIARLCRSFLKSQATLRTEREFMSLEKSCGQKGVAAYDGTVNTLFTNQQLKKLKFENVKVNKKMSLKKGQTLL